MWRFVFASLWMMRLDGRKRSWNRLKNSYGYLQLLFSAGATKLDHALILVGTLAAIAAGVPFPLLGVLFGQLVDDLNSRSCDGASQERDGSLPPGVITKVLLMIVISAANFVAIYTHATCWSFFGERLVGRLRRRYFKSLLHQEMAFFDSLPAGEVPTRLTTDMEIVRTGTSEKVGIFISSISYFAGAYIVAFLKVPKLAGMLTFMIPAYILMVMVGGKFIGNLTNRTSAHLASAAALVSQALHNVDLVYSLDARHRLESKLVKILLKAQRSATKKAGAAAIQFGFMFFVAYAANALAFWQGSKEIARSIENQSNKVTAGSVYTVIFVLLDASFVISQIAPFLQIFSAATGASQSLIFVSNRESKICARPKAIESEGQSMSSPEVRFEHVSFSYPARPQRRILHDISMLLAPGKLTAIVGTSGSGKSTLSGLLIRLYNPDLGRIVLANTDVANMPTQDLRRSVGTLDQDPVLFCCSILENLAFGFSNDPDDALQAYCAGTELACIAQLVRDGQTFADVLSQKPVQASKVYQKVCAAAKIADAEDFIASLPYGYATVVGPTGCTLSGGQKQRLALARAIVKNPAVLVLDEATSSLDSLSEQKILSALSESRKGKSTIAIAHRLGTIKHADQIIVMSEGRVVEQGTHDELIALDGAYSGMTEAQSLQLASIVSNEPSDISASTITKFDEEKVTVNNRRPSRLGLRRKFSGGKRQAVLEKETTPPQRKTLSSIAHLVRPRLMLIVVGILGAAIAGGTYSGDAVIFGYTIGHLDPCRGADEVNTTGNLAGLLFFILALAAFIANGVAGSSFGRIAEDLVFKLRVLTFRVLFEQEPLWHTSNGRTPAMLLSFFAKDTASIAGLSGVVVGTILTILVNLLASIIMTHIIAWKIAIVLLATLPILLGSGFMRLYAIARFQIRHQKLYATSASISLEAVSSIKTIASYSLEDEFYKRYARSLKGPYDACLREFAYTNLWLATAYSVSTLIYALAYWWGAKQIAEEQYSQTQFFIVLPALLFSAQSCGQMFALAPDVSTAKVAVDRIFGLIGSSEQSSAPNLRRPIGDACQARAGSDLEKGDQESVPPRAGDSAPGMVIEMDQASFQYPNRPQCTTLKNITLSIPAGSFCAFVGPSGSGKSTMVSLLSTLYTATSGNVLFDGVPALPSTRSSIALMPQESTLFSDTISFNISLGAHESNKASQADIEEAAKAAGIHETIIALPDGYDTFTGPNGTSFSGGQKQRLCLARALLRKPRLLLLDEPSSALDAEAETHLQSTLEELRGGGRGMTIVVVAHRLCTIKTADRIFWVEDGEVRAAGTHEEMVSGCRGYRESALFQSIG